MGEALSLAAFLAYFMARRFSRCAPLGGPLYTTPGCFLPRVESPRRVTLLQSNVYKRLHENSSHGGSAPLAGYVETRVDPARRVEISSILI